MRLKVSRYTHVLDLASGGALLYNGRTGAIAELSASASTRVRALFEGVGAWRARPRSGELLESLVAGGFVVGCDVDELALIRERYESSRQGSQFLFTILPTFACNLGCDYCFVGKKSGHMSREVQDGIVGFARERMQAFPTDMHVDWFGGEPLLAVPVIERLSSAFQQICAEQGVGYRAQVISNGTFIEPRTVEVLQRASVDRIQISIDGPPAIHDARRPYKSGNRSSFEAIVGNLGLLIGKFAVRLRINVDARNLSGVWPLLDLFEARGWMGPDMGFYPYLARVSAFTEACSGTAPFVCSMDDFYRAQFRWMERLEQHGVMVSHHGLYELPEPKLYNCGAVGANGFVFTPDGEIHKCGLEVDNSRQAIGRVGEALDPLNANAARFAGYSPFEKEMCRDCEFLPSCLGGCPRDQMEAREVQVKDNCTFHKKFETKLLMFHLGHRDGIEHWTAEGAVPAASSSTFIPLRAI